MAVSQPLYTYVLRAPVTNTAIYVGKGVWDRAYKHRFQDSAIGAHIRELVSDGLTPSYHRIPVNNADEAFELEQLLVEEIGRRDIGTGSLYNLRAGGRKVVQSDGTRAKLSASHTGKTLSEEHKQSISATLKGRRPSIESCERHSKIMKEWWAMRKSNKEGK